jgi:hypothetical protein
MHSLRAQRFANRAAVANNTAVSSSVFATAVPSSLSSAAAATGLALAIPAQSTSIAAAYANEECRC